jgi:AcrR family transcriptional regulator
MARPRVHDENLRSQLLEHAGRLVTERGMGALSLRALAADAGTSTTAVYSLFGGKPALLGALYEESFSSFGTSQDAVPVTGDTLTDLMALGRAYWSWARGHPHLYSVMFGQALGGFVCTPEQAATAEATIGPLAAVVRSGVETGVLSGDPMTVTFAIWAAVHGVVSLVMADRGPADEVVRAHLFDATALAVVRGWMSRPDLSAAQDGSFAPGPIVACT